MSSSDSDALSSAYNSNKCASSSNSDAMLPTSNSEKHTSPSSSNASKKRVSTDDILDNLTATGRQKKMKLSDVLLEYRMAGRKAVLILNPFASVSLTFHYGMMLDKGGVSNSNISDEQQARYRTFYNGILDMVPGFRATLDEISYDELKPYITVINSAMSSQRSDDFASLKHPMLEYILTNRNSDTLQPPIPKSSCKSNQGTNHPRLARELCPRKWLDKFDIDVDLGIQHLQDGTWPLLSTNWPSFLYAADAIYDSEDPNIGLFRGHAGIRKLAQVTVKGAEHDSRERLPHPQCLEGTRVDLLKYIYGVLDDRSKSRLIWLHGTVGVGKSAVAFTVAERMRGLKVTGETNVEMRLAGTFFFSRKHTNRRTTGRFFAALAYQLASNFPGVRTHMNKAILDNPALLHPDGSLRKQMEALFSRPLRQLKSRLCDCPPLAFVIDALDECRESFDQSTIEPFDENKSEIELAELISLFAQALRDPDLPVTHILVTSRLEAHIYEAMQHKDVHPLVCEIPVRISGHSVANTISLDGADVDEDIYLFLQHSFRKLQSCFPTFPQPTKVQLERSANRTGRRFIVASTMMKFIDDRHRAHARTSDYRAYLHLSVVAALSDPLPMPQISELLGPGEGRDVERVLVQLRSVIDVPTDNNLPVNICHSSVRDYVSHPPTAASLK
ncbi:hypothetical protein BDR04DRAFT_1230715 [Suillus decipiens]|nr:hypothetical protein BDR04DRAFT_1230715 [Suillus decipiens]